MKTRAGLLLTCATGALLIGAGLTTKAGAADVMAVKAAPVAPAGWWFHGDVEVGGRFFLKKEGGQTAGGQESLGKFYEYRDLRPGAFGNVALAAGSNDGLYGIGFWAKNIGYDDQSYFLSFDKAGEHYLDVGYEETPHIYNNNAVTIFQGVGTDNLTVPAWLRAALNAQLTPTVPPAPPATTTPLPTTAAQRANIQALINGNLNVFQLGFERQTAALDYRWTPTDNWDFKVGYAGTHREGTQSMGALAYHGAERGGRMVLELPKPIDDVTHNGNSSLEYAGVTPWGKKFNIIGTAGFSAYENEFSSYRFQNPWITDATGDLLLGALNNRMSLAPDNNANVFALNTGVELPWKSRYTSTVQFGQTRQNDAFLPFTSNSLLAPNGPNFGRSGVSPAPLVFAAAGPHISASSLNGEVNTLLFNNVLTTPITSNLKSTLRYRYYEYDGGHEPIELSYWYLADSQDSSGHGHESFGVNYAKQNASGDLVWNPLRWLTVGSGVGWERYDRERRDVDTTNEYMGRLFVDAKPWEMSRFRASYQHSERRYDEYLRAGESNTGHESYRLFEMANRDRDKANFSMDFYLPGNVTVTPTGGFRFDDYLTNPYALVAPTPLGLRPEMGLLKDSAWNYGIELAWAPSRTVSFIASYIHEDLRRQIMADYDVASGNHGMLDVNLSDKIDTFLIGTNVTIVPERLDVKAAVTYTKAHATFEQAPGGLFPVVASAIPANAGLVGSTAFPDARIAFTRFDLQSKYRFDPAWVQQMGFKGEVYAKLRYVYEHNAVNDWAANNVNWLYLVQPTNSYAKHITLGWDNPNYNVQMLMASVGFKW